VRKAVRRQGDLVLHRAGPVADELKAHISQHLGHRLVVGRDECVESADAFLAGTVGEPGQQFCAESAALPVIDDGDGNLGGVRVFGVRDIAGDAFNDAAILLFIIDGACLVVTQDRARLTWHWQKGPSSRGATPSGRAAGIVTARPRGSQK
jgi:hypothetical protein